MVEDIGQKLIFFLDEFFVDHPVDIQTRKLLQMYSYMINLISDLFHKDQSTGSKVITGNARLSSGYVLSTGTVYNSLYLKNGLSDQNK